MELTSRHEASATTGTERAGLCQSLRARLRDHFTLFKFATTGATGYIVYQLVFLLWYDSSLVWFLPDRGADVNLLGFSHGDARLLITTMVAAELSIVGVFAGHHLWTFHDRLVTRKPLWLRFAQFNAKAVVSSLVILNAVVNALILGLGVLSYISIPVGVAAAFLWNWLWDSRFIWRPVERRNEGG